MTGLVHRQAYSSEICQTKKRDMILLIFCFCFKKLLSSRSQEASDSIQCVLHHFDLHSKTACSHRLQWHLQTGSAWLFSASKSLYSPVFVFFFFLQRLHFFFFFFCMVHLSSAVQMFSCLVFIIYLLLLLLPLIFICSFLICFFAFCLSMWFCQFSFSEINASIFETPALLCDNIM